jgi:hypothetical protein
MEAAQEQSAVPHLRDVLKREHDEAQGRPRNEALEKWGPAIAEMIERDMERRRRLEKPLPQSFPSRAPAMPRKKDGPDMDMELAIVAGGNNSI